MLKAYKQQHSKRMAEHLEEGEGDYVKDGSVDLKGNPVLRSKSGGWKACSFVVGTCSSNHLLLVSFLFSTYAFIGYQYNAFVVAVYEMFERMAFYGISSNLVIYLTNRLHQGTVDASNNVTTWVGAVFLMPILGAYIADAHLGRYWTFVIASAIYVLVTTPIFSISCKYDLDHSSWLKCS